MWLFCSFFQIILRSSGHAYSVRSAKLAAVKGVLGQSDS
jgi:hypothetical protein